MKINPLYKLFIPIAFVAISVLIGFINSSRENKKNYYRKINEVVSKVDISPALRVTLYDRQGNEIELKSYFLYESLGFQVNDSLAKDRNSSTLKIYTKDNIGFYKIQRTIEP